MTAKYVSPTIAYWIDFEHLNSFNYLAFCIGTLCRKYNNIQKLIENKWIFNTSFILFLLLLWGKIDQFNDNLIWVIPWALLPMTGIICCWNLFKFYFTEGRYVVYLQYLGKLSLNIYIIHFFYAIKLVFLGSWIIQLISSGNQIEVSTGTTIQLLASFFIATIVCALCTITYKVLKCSDLIRTLLFGNK